MNRIINGILEEKGSVTIEAALILPFLIAVATLFFAILSLMHAHAVEQISLDSKTIEISMQSYQLSHLGMISTEEAENFQLLDAIEEGNGEALIEEIANMGKQSMVKRWAKRKLEFDVLSYPSDDEDRQIEQLHLFQEKGSGDILLSGSFGFPMMEDKVAMRLLYGGMIVLFDGEGSYNKHVNQGDEEDDDQDLIVYVTPSGTKYHTDPSCFHIKVHATGQLWKNVPSKNICRYCGNGESYNPGRWIYTTRSSRVVHLDNTCSAINHEVRQITLEEAEAEGLSACKSCHGIQ